MSANDTAENSDDTIDIFLKLLDGRTLAINIAINSTVMQIKEIIQTQVCQLAANFCPSPYCRV